MIETTRYQKEVLLIKVIKRLYIHNFSSPFNLKIQNGTKPITVE